MLNLKLQNIKQAAYFDYFKSFSLNAFDTIKKLQTQFKQEIQQSFFFDSNMMFKRVKTLLGSYQILIYQINDSCQFVEIPQFGNCILKIFLQIMSVIRFLLHKIIQKSIINNKNKQDPNPFIDKTNNHNHNYPHNNKTPLHMTQQNLSSSTPQLLQQNQKQIYKKKQQSKYMINNLKQQLSILQMEQFQNIQTSKKQFKSLIQGKQKLQSIEISQNQNILSQALNSFCKKGQHLKTFVNVRQAAMITNMKQGVGQYMKLKDILDQDSNTKLANASIKLQELFKTHTINYYKEKQSEMVTQQIQVQIQDSLENKILQQNKHIKKLNDIIRRLNDQMGFERQRIKSLQNLLKSKTQEFQLKTMEYRVAKIQMENLKNKHQKILQQQMSQLSVNNLHSKSDLCSNCHNKFITSGTSHHKKSQIDCISKSAIQGSQQNQLQGSQQCSDRNHDDTLQNPSRLMQKMTRRVHYQNTSSLTKKQLAFRPLDSKADELDLYSSIWSLKIEPDLFIQQKSPNTPSSKKRTIIARVTSTNMNYMNNTVSYRDHRRIKTKMLTSQSKNSCLQIERVVNFNFVGIKIGGVANGGLNDNKLLLNVKKYSRKYTDGGNSQNEEVIKQVTQKWLNNDGMNQDDGELKINQQSYQLFKRNKIISDQIERQKSQDNICYSESKQQKKNSRVIQKGQAELMNKQNMFSRPDKQFLKNLQKKSYAYPLLKKSLSKSQNLLNIKQQQLFNNSTQQYKQLNQHSKTLLQPSQQIQNQSVLRLTFNNMIPITKQYLKYPKFIKFNNSQHKISLNMKDLINLFFDVNTAKNFQYINLFQNDDVKINSVTMKNKPKQNHALTVNIQQMQKKNFINGLISKVKGQVNAKNHYQLMANTQTIQQSNNKLNKPHTISECPSMNCTFSGTLMKTQFWNQLTHQAHNQQQELDHLLKCYDFQSLTAMLFKHLRDLKRVTITGTQQLTYYQLVRNFLRYPFSSISLQSDKTFLQKQKQQSAIDYLQLRKIMQRVFKLHKNCKMYQCKNSFQKLGIKDFTRGNCDQNDNQNILCYHLIQFFESVGILLMPKTNKQIETKQAINQHC